MKLMPINYKKVPGVPQQPIQDFAKKPVIEGVARKPSNEKVISLEELKENNESGFDVPNKGRAPNF